MEWFSEGHDAGEEGHTLAEWFFARVAQELGTRERSFDRRFAFLGADRRDAVLGWYWVHRQRFARFRTYPAFAGDGWPAGEWLLDGEAVRVAIAEAILTVLPIDEGMELYLKWLEIPVIVEVMFPKVQREPSGRELLRRAPGAGAPRRWASNRTRKPR